MGTRLASWLLLGNAGALAIVFKATLDRNFCNQSDIHIIIWCFSIGLFSAFAGSTVSYFTSFIGLMKISRTVALVEKIAVSEYYIEKLEADGIEISDDSQLNLDIDEAGRELQVIERKQHRIWFGFWASVCFYLLSAGAFTTGILLPVTKLSASLQSCALTKATMTTATLPSEQHQRLKPSRPQAVGKLPLGTKPSQSF